MLLSLWAPRKPGDFFNDTWVWANAARSTEIVDRAVLRAERGSQAYAKAVLRAIGAPASPDLGPARGVYPRANVTIPEVYARPATAYRWALTQAQHAGAGDADAELAARRALRDRVWELAEMDVQLAKGRSERDAYASSPLTIGYRRVIHPELSKTGVCGLCVVASTRFYTLSEMKPIHDHCKCTSLPLTESSDPGLKLNEDDLRKFYARAGSTSGMSSGRNPDGGRGLKALRYQSLDDIQEFVHSEIGPMLAPRGVKVRDQASVGKSRWHEPDLDDQRRIWRHHVEMGEVWVRELERAVSEGRPHEFWWDDRLHEAVPEEEPLSYWKKALPYWRKRLAALG